MKDDVAALDCVRDALVALDVAFDDVDVAGEAGEVLAVAGREVVEDADVGAVCEKALDEARADESGAAGDEDLAEGVAHRREASVGEPEVGLEPTTPSLPWKCSTN